MTHQPLGCFPLEQLVANPRHGYPHYIHQQVLYDEPIQILTICPIKGSEEIELRIETQQREAGGQE